MIAAPGDGAVMANGYRRIRSIGHPLAMKWGYVLEHRFALYNAIGPGTHQCHWCAKPVTWKVPGCGSGGEGTLVVDHVDANKLNNDISNLVPSCNSCNIRRANARRRRTPPH